MTTSESQKRAYQNYLKKGPRVLISQELADILNQWKEAGFKSRIEYSRQIARNYVIYGLNNLTY
jgi:hypothetical protein